MRGFATLLEQEIWQHAACLSIAEGAPGWQEAANSEHASPAMRAVAALLQRWQTEREHVDELVREVRALKAQAHRCSFERTDGGGP